MQGDGISSLSCPLGLCLSWLCAYFLEKPTWAVKCGMITQRLQDILTS